MSVCFLILTGVRSSTKFRICQFSAEIFGKILIVNRKTTSATAIRSASSLIPTFNDRHRRQASGYANQEGSEANNNSNEEIDPADTFGYYSFSSSSSKSSKQGRVRRQDHRQRKTTGADEISRVWTSSSSSPKVGVSIAGRPHVGRPTSVDRLEASKNQSTATSKSVKSVEDRRIELNEVQLEEVDVPLQTDVYVENTFGLLDKMWLTRQAEAEEGDEEEKKDEADRLKRLSLRPNKSNTMYWYGRQIKKLADNKELTEALAFFKRMIEVDRVTPDSYVYSNLIGGCGRAGYTKMAFKLHQQMKERALNVPLAVYTGLFNACANSPWPEDGLRLARKLQAEIDAKAIILNSTNYNAAIKAFGRCNDLQAAFRLIDEMIAKKVGVTTMTFNFLLMACASDKEQGFLRTIQVWKKMRQQRIKPDIYSFNLLIRAVRDCGLGDPKLAGQLILLSVAKNEPARRLSLETLLLNDTSVEAKNANPETTLDERHLDSGLNSQETQYEIENSFTTTTVVRTRDEIPDVLSPWTNAGNVVSLNAAETAQDRLSILGGCMGILRRMRMYKVKPELKTFTQLIEIVPANEELMIIEAMDNDALVVDVDFFNVLLKKRSCGGDWDGAKEVLSLIAQRHLYADIATFGALALGCKRWDHAKQLLDDMKTSGFRPNSKILGAMIKKATQSMDFWYLIDMLKRLKADEVQVDTRMLRDIERCVARTKNFIVKKERAGQNSSIDKLSESFRVFYMFYMQFLKENDVELPEHPWKIYELDQQSAEDVK